MRRGFTIIEITIVVVIAAILLIIVGTMFASQWQLYRSEATLTEVKTQNIIAQKIITAAIEESIRIIASSTINSTSYLSDGDTIVLMVPSIDSNQDIIPSNYDHIAFELDPVNSIIVSDTEKAPLSARTDGKKTIAQFVNTLNFSYNDSVWDNVNKVEITLITQKQDGNITRENRSFKAVKMENR